MKVLVTGATGFLGFKICEMLLAKPNTQVVAIGRNKAKGKELREIGCEFISADLRDKTKLTKILNENIEGVIHSAALSSPWGLRSDFININQIGTRNLVQVSEAAGVKDLVFISSPSVYFDFTDRLNIKESDTVATNWPSVYTETKYLAEQEVLKTDKMNTVILRPRGLYGPGDTAIIPRLIRANNEGRLPIIGNGKTLTDLTYIDNAAHAAILALDKCAENNREIFNISNGEPIALWDYLSELLEELGQTFNPKKVPFPVVYTACYLSELKSKYLTKQIEPTLTRYTAGLLAKSLTLDISKAKEKLGYEPLVNMQEGKKRLISWAKEQEGLLS